MSPSVPIPYLLSPSIQRYWPSSQPCLCLTHLSLTAGSKGQLPFYLRCQSPLVCSLQFQKSIFMLSLWKALPVPSIYLSSPFRPLFKTLSPCEKLDKGLRWMNCDHCLLCLSYCPEWLFHPPLPEPAFFWLKFKLFVVGTIF